MTIRTQTTGNEFHYTNIKKDLDCEYVEGVWNFLRAQEKHLTLEFLKVEISQLVYFTQAKRSPFNLQWDSMTAAGHPQTHSRCFHINWKDDGRPREANYHF